MQGVELWSSNSKLGIRLSNVVLTQIVEICSKDLRKETGGILLGRYTENLRCAEITEISEPPKDSGRGATWLSRGVFGLKKTLEAHWEQRREYYIGEWHLHPCSDVRPSQVDQVTMFSIARSSLTSCPEPILLIIGVSNQYEFIIGAYVFTKDILFLSPKNEFIIYPCKNGTKIRFISCCSMDLPK